MPVLHQSWEIGDGDGKWENGDGRMEMHRWRCIDGDGEWRLGMGECSVNIVHLVLALHADAGPVLPGEAHLGVRGER